MKVQKRVKAARGRPYHCGKCAKEIEAGQEFFFWTFRYGGTRRQHVACGYPRPSQLTQSRMGDVYAAIEAVEDTISTDAWVIEDATSGVEELASVVDEVVQAYEEAAEHFGGQGENAERAETLEAYRDQLDQLDLSEWEDADEERDCDECGGEGRVECDHCGGDGSVEGVSGRTFKCQDCDGEGTVDCSECNGTGKVEPEGEPGAWREDAKGHVEETIGGAP